MLHPQFRNILGDAHACGGAELGCEMRTAVVKGLGQIVQGDTLGQMGRYIFLYPAGQMIFQGFFQICNGPGFVFKTGNAAQEIDEKTFHVTGDHLL